MLGWNRDSRGFARASPNQFGIGHTKYMKPFIELDSVSFTYHQENAQPLIAVDHVSLSIQKGQHVAILGRNGSGKSTLARLINALEQPDEGSVLVDGLLTNLEENIWEIRRRCGMVFQNPDNQIIGTTVEEDVAFGPENLGFAQPKIRKAVDEALAYVGLSDMAQKPPHFLSGGQKQKLAIAGILAMRPACLILDEATSMLDPYSSDELMKLVHKLIKDEHLTVINITHNMEEALLADFVYVMSEGKIILSGKPAEVFDQVETVKSLGLDVPVHCDILYQLSSMLDLPLMPQETADWSKACHAAVRLLDQSEAAGNIHLLSDQSVFNKPGLVQDGSPNQPEPSGSAADGSKEEKIPLHLTEHQQQAAEKKPKNPEAIVEVDGLTYTYTPGTVLSTDALHDVSFKVFRGELLGVIGHSGSGKSTLIQHLNGLLRTQTGRVEVLNLDASNNHDIRKIRQHVGLVFQYPEHQLFEETVFQDIAFGPKRLGLDMNQVEQRVLKAARIVSLSEDMLERSPFELSGGQKRRAAIAGVLAMEPDVLIMDEPAAGLDPAGRDELLGYAAKLREMGVTVILVSHSMDDIARMADRVLVLNEGRVHAYGTLDQIFNDDTALKAAGLSLPRPVAFMRMMKTQISSISEYAYTPEQAAIELIRAYCAQTADQKTENQEKDDQKTAGREKASQTKDCRELADQMKAGDEHAR